MVLPLVVNAQLVRVDVPVMIAFSGVFLVCALDGRISALDGLLLLGLWLIHAAVTVVLGRRDTAAAAARRDQVARIEQGPPETT